MFTVTYREHPKKSGREWTCEEPLCKHYIVSFPTRIALRRHCVVAHHTPGCAIGIFGEQAPRFSLRLFEEQKQRSSQLMSDEEWLFYGK